MRQGYLICQFSGRTVSHVQKPHLVALRLPGASLYDVGGYRDRRTPHLGRESKPLLAGKMLSLLIDGHGKGVSEFVSPQLGVVSHAVTSAIYRWSASRPSVFSALPPASSLQPHNSSGET